VQAYSARRPAQDEHFRGCGRGQSPSAVLQVRLSLSPVCIVAGRRLYCSLTGAVSLCYARTLLDARPCMLPRLLGARTLSSFFLSRQAVWKQAGSVERLSSVLRCTVRRLLRCRAPVCLQKADITLCDVFGNTALDDALRHDQLAVGAFPSHRSPLACLIAMCAMCRRCGMRDGFLACMPGACRWRICCLRRVRRHLRRPMSATAGKYYTKRWSKTFPA